VSWEGLLLVDKPQGPTSHDIVDRVRKATGQRRVGHAGTLDPMATGLLPLVLGRATRLVRFLPHAPKEYRGSLRLGLTTSTDDVTGEVLTRPESPLPAAGQVREAAAAFLGRSMQVPPVVSARKVGGERMYRLARKGVEVSAKPAQVEILRFELAATERGDTYDFVAEVSAGTYVRSLARDLGAALGCGATLAALRRTAIGPLRPDPELALDPSGPADVARLAAALIPLDRIPLQPPAARLTDETTASRFLHGGAVALPPSLTTEGPAAVYGPDGGLLGVAEARGGRLLPRVVLPEQAI
jgi:tRNA pseudouridine55 synthase